MRQLSWIAPCVVAVSLQTAVQPVVTGREHAAEQTSAPVTLTLRLADDRQFRPGELIPIELEFSSPVAGHYIVDGATGDRSGRLTIDEFRLHPFEGITDPLLDYYAAQRGGYIGGGIRSMGTLGGKPFIVRLELNEWFRFDRPGTYTLSVRSSRVTDEPRRTSTDPGIVPVQSNAVTIEILPRTGDWESARIAEALGIIDGPATEVERRAGCRILRFLASEMAVEQMIRRFIAHPWLPVKVNFLQAWDTTRISNFGR